MDTSHIRVEFRSPYNIKILFHILETHSFTFTSIGTFYLPQIGRIFLDMLGLYKAVSGIISETVAREGEAILASPIDGRSAHTDG